MRVIAGTARSMPLKTIKGMDTRPTTDKIKETLFNTLQTDVPDSRFLDLFGGSGAIAIEALSRGAAYAVLVEQNSKAVRCIKDNLIFTRLKDRADVYQCDALTGLRRLEGQKPFDIIFMDPPYDQGLEQQVLTYLADRFLWWKLLWKRIFPIWKSLDIMLTNIKNTKRTSIYFCRKIQPRNHEGE